MTVNKIDALLALRSEGRFLVGRDRIKLLEAVAEHGSITKAAKVVGFSYKTAWDAVNAINNLLPSPAFVTKAGGRSGGGAEVTAEGRRLIATFHRLEERLSRISSLIAEEGLEDQEDFLLWSVGVKISTRNVFQTEVVQVKKWPVDVEVTLRVSAENSILAVVTNDAANELGLEPGRKALALIKSSFVNLAPVDHAPSATRNRFLGTVKRRIDAERNSEILLDIGGGKTMTAVVPRQTAEDLGISEGDQEVATFNATNVILAVD
ncbi:MAG: molybdenum-dependent transcriptional regulator [Methylocystaceae bacterium]|nr:MAG: molybdenum-dependent transcriptional regulator [Methylocystaceae bacterium]